MRHDLRPLLADVVEQRARAHTTRHALGSARDGLVGHGPQGREAAGSGAGGATESATLPGPK